MFYWKLKTSKK